MLRVLLGTGVFLTIRLRFVQEVRFREAPRAMVPARSTGEGPFVSGGPGALFWSWVYGFFG